MIDILSPFGDGFGFSSKTFYDYDEVKLYPEEVGLISLKAIQKRKVEFYLGRAAARSALRQINIYNFPVLKGANNEPLWPKGVVGAISHSGTIALAVAVLKDRTAGIGVDIELIDQNVSEDIVKEVCTFREATWVNLQQNQKIERLLMIFSAKESAFKAFFPIKNVFLNYLDAEFSWNEDIGSFSGKLLKSAGGDYEKGYTFEVGCKIIDKYIFTFMKLPPMGLDMSTVNKA
ncbi:4'-phosphopantetheinyl transferase EntD [Sporomusaceae bacterium BoRhaA]|uniref:4'-phosphopantetheinyl transferase family protein n=1 Tax=Pelorhabdus rhamnosifermentans TaxID=2772457 RepID=UPI001FE2FDDE|nr:4'-phosphopantetheinyl transferase superfamily protein [Pelorhabdus rhamnosifermentans]MBU2699293.1 4'-phosphopantetheinyl transferase EntD [Pelorhabdus rhamnosifermentans]